MVSISDTWDKYEQPDHRSFNSDCFEETLIYSMGRCGSTSIIASMRKHEQPTLAGHWLQYNRTHDMDSSSPAEYATPHFGFVDLLKNKIYREEDNMNIKTTKRLLYTMGRVGTSSINKALNDAGQPAFSGHWFQHGTTPPAEYPAINNDLVQRIKVTGGKPLKVIIPIREPVARNIAAYFRVLHRKDVMPLERYKTVDDEHIQAMFMKDYNIHYPDQWFELEPMDLFDFNPFESDFPHDIGWKIYKAGLHEILIIRLENCNDQLHHALHQLLGVDGIRMEHVNEYKGGGNNIYGEYGVERYKNFKKLPLPLDFVEKNYNLKYAQHFWSDEERENLINGWTVEVK